jgi:hypothetical protein
MMSLDLHPYLADICKVISKWAVPTRIAFRHIAPLCYLRSHFKDELFSVLAASCTTGFNHAGVLAV